jgi:hypothetical protein
MEGCFSETRIDSKAFSAAYTAAGRLRVKNRPAPNPDAHCQLSAVSCLLPAVHRQLHIVRT